MNRRKRELNENNTKKFIEERKRQAVTHLKAVDTLKQLHIDQLECIIVYSQKVSFYHLLTIIMGHYLF